MAMRQLAAAVMAAILLAAVGCKVQAPVGGAEAAERKGRADATALVTAELVQEHPRLFMRKADIPRIRQTVESLPEAKAQWESLLKRVDVTRAVGYPEAGKPTQPEWAGMAWREGAHAAQCGFLFQMTGQAAYGEWAKGMLLGWAEAFDSKINFELCSDFVTVEPGHAGIGGNTMGFYHGGVLLMNTAMAYDCIYESLTAEERRTIEAGFFRKLVGVMERFDYSKRIPQFAPDFMVNGGQWNGANLCNTGLTAVGFVLNDPRLYERGVKNFKLHLGRDMLSDGFWVEEDRSYSDTCMGSLFNIAWMAKSAGYPEDLFQTVVQAKLPKDYDHKYANTFVSEDGAHLGERSLAMYLDAHLDYQYPNFTGGSWGWYPGRGSATQSGELVGMYMAGYAIYGKPGYGFILQNADRTRSSLGSGVTSLMYFGKPVEKVPPAETRSRVYVQGRWIALKSIEGPAYWNSDSLYAFMAYGTERNKPLQALTLDIFGFGRTLAPRVGLKHQAQSLTTDYQLTEPAWNGVLTDGRNFSLLRERATRAWMAWEDLGKLVKIVSPRIHWVGGRQSELYQTSIEAHPEEDRTTSRILAMTDTYLVDVYHIVYDREPKYHHNFDYVLHGYGELKLEGLTSATDRTSNCTAVWTQEGGVGLRSTMVASNLGSGTKFKTYVSPAEGNSPATAFWVASRAGVEETFVVVHEPVKGASKVAGVRRVKETADHVVLEVTLKDGTVDWLAVRLKDSKEAFGFERSGGKVEEVKGNYLFVRRHADGSEERQ